MLKNLWGFLLAIAMFSAGAVVDAEESENGCLAYIRQLKGRVDVAPVLLNIDLLKSSKTEKTLHMKGLKGDLTLQVYKGIFIKPNAMYAEGKGKIVTGSVALGHYTPLHSRFVFFPEIGIAWSYLRTTIDIEPFGMFDLKERFRSSSPFVGLEAYYYVTDQLTLMGLYQYAWSRTHTKITPIVSEHSHTCGPNYALMLDYKFAARWSVTLGGGYNITLSKEKHGLRGKGLKAGVAYTF